jgi:hypothetical protein
LNYYSKKEIKKFLELNSKVIERLFKEIKPENNGDKKISAFFEYLDILNILVDVPSFDALKNDGDDQREEIFHMFFFFLISCKYKLSRYVYEQIIV